VEVGVLADAVALVEARQPFALASVIWRRGPSSGQVGSKALIRPDGSVQGWLGGACAQPTVVREAQKAIADGRARRLFLGPADEVHPDRLSEGMVTVPMACESEGAMEVYVEPFVPSPQVVVIGRSPAVFTLATLTRDLGWDVAVIDDGGDPADHPHPDLVRTRLDLGNLGIGPSTAIVVATQGHYDDLALEAALRSDAGHVGLVASAKRATSTLELLRDRGFDDEQLHRVTAPAGLDLGRVSNAEIAVAVLADLVARRAAGQLAATGEAATAISESHATEAVDPVCGMTVDPRTSRYHVHHEGRDFWFCAPGCKASFEADPDAYLG
jgi:xanthine dehydrogenase accessory factor